MTAVHRKSSGLIQYLAATGSVLIVSGACFAFSDWIGYRVVALVLLLVVSLLSVLLDIFPVLMAATLSALVWNFFFIPPVFTFHIDTPENLLMFLMYFVVALVNAVLTSKIRKAEKKARDKEEREKTIRLYDTLLNSLSHEMRTPLSTIIGAIDTLKDNSGELSAENKNDLLTQIDLASIRLNRQVENLLSINRLESGMLMPEKDWVDMNELVFSVIRNFSEASVSPEIRFKPDENLPLFKLDEGIMEQVLHNLLHNAVIYTPEKSVIAIEVKYRDEKCRIVISDNGQGFPEDEMKFVFDKFYRLPQSKPGGNGLGLSIVKGFVEAQNGSIYLENNETGGAKFTIEIPAETSFLHQLKNE